MNQFRVENSLTKFLKISYHNLQDDHFYFDFYMVPLCLSEKSDTLLLTKNCESRTILYNWRELE